MLGKFSEDELRQLAESLRKAHGSLDWSVPDFAQEKSAFMARVAQMAYSAVGADERAPHHRAKLVPSETFRAVVAGRTLDFLAVVRMGDFFRVVVVRSSFFVAVILKVQTDIFIGVRGTLFAYDWGINFSARRRRGDPGWHHRWRDRPYGPAARDYEGFLHTGFYRESLILSHLIEQKIRPMLDGDTRIHLSGHSLGGAIAAILAMRGFRSHHEHDGWPQAADAYLYGAPRIGSSRAVRDAVVYATRRENDLVPHTPPRWLGYADFLLEFGTDGLPYLRRRWALLHAARWLRHIYLPLIVKDHKLETYIREIDRTVYPSFFPNSDY